MLTPLILEAAALLAVIWVLISLTRVPDNAFSSRTRIMGPLAAAALTLTAAVILNTMSWLNAPGTPSEAVFGNRRADLQARAEEWLRKHANEPPAKDEVARNIRIITDGLAFLRPYHAQLPPHLRLQLEEASRLPTTLTRMLSPTEERQYYDSARAVVEAVRSVAAQPPKP